MHPIIVKIGGRPLGEADTLFSDLVSLQKTRKKVVVVHGGGNIVSDWQKLHKIESRFIRGLRITTQPGLEVAAAVLAGLVNKDIVASIQANGGRVIGLSGIDGEIIKAKISDPELGYVGTVTSVATEPLDMLLKFGYLPVLSPIASQQKECDTNWKGMLNVNADTVAGELSISYRAQGLIFLTDVEGIIDETGQTISHISEDKAKAMIVSGTISGGMIPKVEECLKATKHSVKAVITDGRRPNALIDAINGKGPGTWFS